jgi:bifunctional NMN adenylyltransferase/nudix hydrolase
LKFIGTCKVPDWRYRSEEDKIFTILYKSKKFTGDIQPSDDVSELKWWNIDELKSLVPIVDEHKPLMLMILKNLNKI